MRPARSSTAPRKGWRTATGRAMLLPGARERPAGRGGPHARTSPARPAPTTPARPVDDLGPRAPGFRSGARRTPVSPASRSEPRAGCRARVGARGPAPSAVRAGALRREGYCPGVPPVDRRSRRATGNTTGRARRPAAGRAVRSTGRGPDRGDGPRGRPLTAPAYRPVPDTPPDTGTPPDTTKVPHPRVRDPSVRRSSPRRPSGGRAAPEPYRPGAAGERVSPPPRTGPWRRPRCPRRGR